MHREIDGESTVEYREQFQQRVEEKKKKSWMEMKTDWCLNFRS